MSNLKSLADQLRQEIDQPVKAGKRRKPAPDRHPILEAMQQYDTSGHNSLVHFRLDEKTLALLNYFKMATGTEISKFAAFAVRELIEKNPGIKSLIKEFIQNLEL